MKWGLVPMCRGGDELRSGQTEEGPWSRMVLGEERVRERKREGERELGLRAIYWINSVIRAVARQAGDKSQTGMSLSSSEGSWKDDLKCRTCDCVGVCICDFVH